jgi:antitoxin (DNA-binding transcriptional repressor) of toxin-antitoxin stability system
MKLVALNLAKNQLSALIDQVEAGEEIVITRHRKPAARLALMLPLPGRSLEESRAAFAKVRENSERLAREQPETCIHLSLEELKADMDENR